MARVGVSTSSLSQQKVRHEYRTTNISHAHVGIIRKDSRFTPNVTSQAGSTTKEKAHFELVCNCTVLSAAVLSKKGEVNSTSNTS